MEMEPSPPPFSVLPDDHEDALVELARLFHDKSDPALDIILARYGRRALEAMIGRAQTAPTLADGRPAEGWQDEFILQDIPRGSRVLDLGCGDGRLLARLMAERQASAQGVELDVQHALACIERGVPVFQADIDRGLEDFADGDFDYVVLEETLQTLRHPSAVLREMRRVGRRGIVGFPNFGYWRVRLDLAVRGRMPVTAQLPHRWYDTPNIHCLSLRDFLDESATLGLNILSITVMAEGEVRPYRPGDNLFAEEALCVFEGAKSA